MQHQAMVIGLGQFGMAVARELSERNAEVFAVDARQERVRVAASFATHAVCFDATNESDLASASPGRRDVCVCAIGDEAKDASIICTALLRQLGAKRVVARANDSVHARILTLVGAHRVVNPEDEFGKRIANQILHDRILGELPLGGGLLVSEIDAPGALVGHDLMSLRLPARFGLTVVAIRNRETGGVQLPRADYRVAAGDVLVLVGREGAAVELLERS